MALPTSKYMDYSTFRTSLTKKEKKKRKKDGTVKERRKLF
jgi:translation initiation factor IF-3